MLESIDLIDKLVDVRSFLIEFNNLLLPLLVVLLLSLTAIVDVDFDLMIGDDEYSWFEDLTLVSFTLPMSRDS